MFLHSILAKSRVAVSIGIHQSNLCFLKGKEIEVAVATKVEKEAKQKGDLMANDAEAMEYSSEDISDDDLVDMNYAGYKNKRRRVGLFTCSKQCV